LHATHNRRTRCSCLVLIIVLLAGALAGIFPGVERTTASTETLPLGSGSDVGRLNPTDFPDGSYRTGELAVALKDPNRENLDELLDEYSSSIYEGSGEVISALGDGTIEQVIRLRLRPGVDELEAARLLSDCPLVKRAEPNVIFHAATTNPNDTLYTNGQQYNLNGTYGVRANEAWDIQKGSAGLTLAVIDTGMDYNHEDLIGRRVDGYDFYNNDSDPRDDNGHGTMISGAACANTNNAKGVAGMDWNAKIMPLKALGANGEGSLDNVVNSIYRAANNGANVINMSLTSTTYSKELQDAVEYAHSRGCVMVAAAGNEGDSRIDYPAGLTYVIGVGSIDDTGIRSSFSNHNSFVDLVAPGKKIFGPYIGAGGNQYAWGSGTSEATPQVSGAALLLLAQYPGSSPEEVWRRLEDGARDLGAPGYDEEYGWGLLDINASLRDPLVNITSPQEYSYPSSGKVSATATDAAANVKYLELWLDGDLLETYESPSPGVSVSHAFDTWDLNMMPEGTHTITVKAIDSSGQWEGKQGITVYRNQSQPQPANDWYLAEGSTAWGFEEYVLVQNPNPVGAAVHATFMKQGGATQDFDFSMPAFSRLTIPVNSLVPTSDISTHIHADQAVVAERAMYWGGRTGGHDAVGANNPNPDWYLAEGSTAWGFEEYVLVQNPNPVGAAVHATFMKQGGATQDFDFSMPAFSRLTIPVNSLVPTSDISTHIHADQAVVAERAMYWGGRDGGHATLGVTEGCATWYLAEGSTAWGFEEYVLVQNPNPLPANVTLYFMKPGGSQVRAAYSVGPMSRFTINVADIVPGSDVSTFIQADRPVIAERAMYWPKGSRTRVEGHCSTGSMTGAKIWYLAEGSTAWGFDEYILLMNPTESIAHVGLNFMRTDGSTQGYTVNIPSKARMTVHANEVDTNHDASVQVTCDQPLVVERAMYWSEKEGGTDALGVLKP
jgi:thermitase